MKKVTLFSFAVAVLFASCSTENSPIEEPQYGTISTQVAGFGISVQEENTFATKAVNDWSNFVTNQFGNYTYNLYNAGTTTLATIINGSANEGALVSWGDAFNWTLNYGKYDFVVTNADAATTTPRPTTELSGVVYTSTTSDITVDAASNTNATFGSWEMKTTVVSAKAADEAADTYLATLQSYKLTINDGTTNLIIASDANLNLGSRLTSTALAQGYFDVKEVGYEIKFESVSTDGTTNSAVTGTTAILTAGQEVVITISAKKGTVGLAVAAPTGATTDGGKVEL